MRRLKPLGWALLLLMSLSYMVFFHYGISHGWFPDQEAVVKVLFTPLWGKHD